MQYSSERDGRQQELIRPTRQHPEKLILPPVYSTKYPGQWVCVYEGSIPADQRNSLWIEGYQISDITLLHDQKAQVTISEEIKQLWDDEPTKKRYEQYDPKK